MSETFIDEKKLKKVAKMFTVVSNPVRMTILDMLAEKQRMNVTQIYTKLNIVQPAASNHLKLLKDCGVLNSKREAHEIYYSINHETIDRLRDVIERLSSKEY
jgi:ArsR family transcriptional regulator, arsenate/arsenite/antimonite-responsive transcriptional repressor